MSEDKRKNNRVLFVRHAAIGDVLFTTPFLRQFQETHPAAAVDLFSLVGESMAKGAGFNRWIPLQDVSPRQALRRGHEQVYWFSYEHDHSLHILDGYQIATGLKLHDRTLLWKVGGESLQNAAHLLSGLRRPLIGFSPTSAHGLRTLSLPKIRELVALLSRRLEGTIVLTSDQQLEVEGCLNLSGQLPTLDDLGSVISQCDAWVTVDSAPLHLAQALGVQAVGIFGCTLPELRVTRPSHLRAVRQEALECLGCYHRLAPQSEIKPVCDRGDLACMESIDAEAVVRATQEALAGSPSPALFDRMATYEAYRCQRMGALGAGYAKAAVDSYRARILSFSGRFGFFKVVERKLRQQRKSLVAWLQERV